MMLNRYTVGLWFQRLFLSGNVIFSFLANATCDSIVCATDEKCLLDRKNGLPRCVSCKSCYEGVETARTGNFLCGTNNQTYQTWCDMMRDSCRSGYVIEAQHAGSCELGTFADISNIIANRIEEHFFKDRHLRHIMFSIL